jgi:hypothetical protein
VGLYIERSMDKRQENRYFNWVKGVINNRMENKWVFVREALACGFEVLRV